MGIPAAKPAPSRFDLLAEQVRELQAAVNALQSAGSGLGVGISTAAAGTAFEVSDAIAESISTRIQGHLADSTTAISDKLAALMDDIKATASESKLIVGKMKDLLGHAGSLAQITLELQQKNDNLRAFAARMAIQSYNSGARAHNGAIFGAYLHACKVADHARATVLLDTPLMLVHPGPTVQVLVRLGQAHMERHHDATHDTGFNVLMPFYGLDPIADGSNEALVPATFFAVCPHSIQAALDLSLDEIVAFGRHVGVYYFLGGAAPPTSFVKDAVEQNRMVACHEILKFMSGR